MDGLELRGRIGPNPLRRSILHGLDLNAGFSYLSLGLGEKPCVLYIARKHEISNDGDEAGHATFKNE